MCNENLVDRIRKLCEAKLYDEALELLAAEVPEGAMLPDMLILKAHLIQLSSDESPYELGDAPRLYELATKLAPDAHEPLYESGMYHMNVQDDPRKGLEYLCRARDVLVAQLESTKDAIRECERELDIHA